MNIDIERRVAQAEANFYDGCSCSQSVVLAFQDILGVDEASLRKLSIGLGAGVGRLREVCGTVGAMAMVAGCLADIEGKPAQQQKAESYAIVQDLARRFKELNGTIICRELLNSRLEARQSPVPQARTEEYYKVRPCPGLVACSARIIAEYIAKNY